MSDTHPGSAGRPPGHGRFNLNQDITRALDELGKVDYSHVLRTHFPPRNLTPREYARVHAVERRVKSVFLGPGDAVPTACPRGWDLLAVVGVGLTRRETEDVVAHLEEAKTGERVLVGVPLQALPGSAQFKELAALDHLAGQEPYDEEGPAREALTVRRESLRKSLLDRLRKAMAPASFRWLHLGQVMEEAPAGTRNAFFSGVLQTLYPDTPRVHVGGNRREQREALDELLELSNPLQLPSTSRRGSARILRRLADRGILDVESDNGSYVRYTVHGELPEERTIGPTWNRLLDRLVGPGDRNRKVALAEVTGWLQARPMGLRGPLVSLLLGAALRRHYPDLELVQDGNAIPPSGVALRMALASPKDWTLHYHPTTEDEESFLTALQVRFGGGAEDRRPGGPNLWDRTRDAMLAWRDRLPGVARSAREWPSAEARGLMELLEDDARTANARDLIGQHLTDLFGADGIPFAEDQHGLLEQIDAPRKQMEGFLAARQLDLLREICLVLSNECSLDGIQACLDEKSRQWVEGLHPGTAGRSFSEWAEGMRHVITSDAPFEERWFVELPQRLDLPAVRDWNPDQGRTFLARLARARLELELWRLRELFPLPTDPVKRTAEVRRWIREAMDGSQLSVEQRESLLIDLLDSLVWK